MTDSGSNVDQCFLNRFADKSGWLRMGWAVVLACPMGCQPTGDVNDSAAQQSARPITAKKGATSSPDIDPVEGTRADRAVSGSPDPGPAPGARDEERDDVAGKTQGQPAAAKIAVSRSVVHKLCNADPIALGVELQLGQYDWDSVSEEIADVAVEIYQRSRKRQDEVMRENAHRAAMLPMGDIEKALDDHSAAGGERRQSAWSFLNWFSTQQSDTLETWVAREHCAGLVIRKMGPAAAPSLAAAGEEGFLHELKSAAIEPLLRSAANPRGRHRLASYFWLRRCFPDTYVPPLPADVLWPIATNTDHRLQRQAVADLVEGGQAEALIAKFLEDHGDKPKHRWTQADLETAYRRIEECNQDLAEPPKNIPPWRFSGVYQKRGCAHVTIASYHLERNNTEGTREASRHAMKDFDKALELSHYDAEDLKDAKQLCLTRSIVLGDRGVLRMQQGDYEQAIADFTAKLLLRPELASTHVSRAECHLALGQFKAAAEDYSMAAEINCRGYRSEFESAIPHYRQNRLREIAGCRQRQADALRRAGETEAARRVQADIIQLLSQGRP